MKYNQLLKNVLSQNAHFQVNKALIQSVGLIEAAVVSLLVDTENLFSKEVNNNDGWFFMTADKARQMLNIGRRPYETALNNIISAGLVESAVRGCPPKKYFRLKYENIIKVLSSEGVQINLSEMNNSICTERTIQFVQNEQINLSEMNNNKNNNNKYNTDKDNSNKGYYSSRIINNNTSNNNNSPSIPHGEVESVSNEELMFEEFRKAYLGTKRGLRTEFENFKKKHKDWREVLPILKVAYEQQIAAKQSAKGSIDTRYEKHLQTYINNRCWEEEVSYEHSKNNSIKHEESDAAKLKRAIEEKWVREGWDGSIDW